MTLLLLLLLEVVQAAPGIMQRVDVVALSKSPETGPPRLGLLTERARNESDESQDFRQRRFTDISELRTIVATEENRPGLADRRRVMGTCAGHG